MIGKGRVHNMNAYIEMNRRHQEEVSAFPMAFAFGDEQLKEAMKKLGLKPSDTDKVCTIYGAGDIIRKSDLPAYREMQKRHREELFNAINSDETGDGFVFDMFDYELANHEYGYTRDPHDALMALGMSLNKVANDDRLRHGFEKACRNQAQWYDEHN